MTKVKILSGVSWIKPGILFTKMTNKEKSSNSEFGNALLHKSTTHMDLSGLHST